MVKKRTINTLSEEKISFSDKVWTFIDNNAGKLSIVLILLMFLSGYLTEKDNIDAKQICKAWNENSNKEELITDDLTNEKWVKCCIQRVQEDGVIKECKYIKLE